MLKSMKHSNSTNDNNDMSKTLSLILFQLSMEEAF